MRTILVATDFSEAAAHATKYAVELVGHFHAKIILFHAYETPVQIPESYIFFDVEQVGQEALQRLDEEEKKIAATGFAGIEKCVDSGVSAMVILDEAKRKNAELVICGMKNSFKLVRKLFGSIATDLAQKTTIPLLLVPESPNTFMPGNIVLALDPHTSPTQQHVEFLKELGEKFNAKLAMVSVLPDFDKATQFRDHCAGLVRELENMQPSIEVINDSDVPRALAGFIAGSPVTLLVVIATRHGWFSRLLSGSVTKELAFISEIPMLVLPAGYD